MPKGGARARSGPAPDPNALRRERDEGEWVTLPAKGPVGPAPEWPLSRQLKREAAMWERLWTMPQAFMWERNRQHLEVAVYVRRLVEAEVPKSQVNLSTLVRQMSDSLGLTTPGLRANRWKIERVEEAGAPTKTVKRAASGTRARLKVVADDAMEGS